MARPFRFTPPLLRPGSLTRPRLLRALLDRWEHRLTIVVGGAGLGKTTLLAQVVTENALAPRGVDVWLEVEADDADAAHLCADLRAALSAPAKPSPSPQLVADAVWGRAPAPVCLVLDDAHRIAGDSPGMAALVELLDVLPANGHLLLASRTRLPLPTARLAAHGQVLELADTDLLFDSEELAEFAARRSVPLDLVTPTGGWPALAELASGLTRAATGDFLWEEVIRPLTGEQRQALAVLCDLGGGDDDLIEAATGRPVDLDSVVGGLPLIARDVSGWLQPHALWRPVATSHLPVEDADRVRAAAVSRLVERGRLGEAFELIARSGLWTEAPALLRYSCLSGRRPSSTQLRGWLARSPDDVRSSAGGRLAAGVLASMVDPPAAQDRLAAAATGFRDAGDTDGEVAALTHLGRVAWWRQDLATLATTVAPRVADLADAGSQAAHALHLLGRGMLRDMSGDDAGVLAALAEIPAGSVDPAWEAAVAWYRGVALHAIGDIAGAIRSFDDGMASADGVFRLTLRYSRQLSAWARGEVDAVLADASLLRREIEAVGIVRNIAGGFADGSRAASHVGRGGEAAALLTRAKEALDPGQPNALVRVALAEASLSLLQDDDENAARETLRAAMSSHPLESGPPRRPWRDALALTYVSVPESREVWESADLQRHWAIVRDLTAAVVAGREGGRDPLRSLDLSDLGVVRAALHVRYAAELAVRLHQAGRAEGAALAELLGPPGRAFIRSLATEGTPGLAAGAKALLAEVPQPPHTRVEVRVLGPVEVRRDGEPVVDSELRRERVRSLLAYLLSHRATVRDAILAALWPDLGERAAGNNLRVTLSYLLRALEPWRTDHEPSYFVRLAGTQVRVLLTADTDEFDRHVASARDAEAGGAVSRALEHHLAAVALYRGDLYEDLAEADWFALQREHYRSRCRSSAVRAAQLLLASGEVDRAEQLAHRAIALDPWSEQAFAVLVDAALSRGDDEAARVILDRCLKVIAELSVPVSDDIRLLQRRVRGAARRR